MQISMPETGLSKESIFNSFQTFKKQDADWRNGKTFSLVFYPGEEITELIQQAYLQYFFENGLNPSVFRSLKRMETEVVSMTASLLNAPADAAGNMTSGGTESIICAMKAAKKYAKSKNKNLQQPNAVMPVTAHPAFFKAADYLEMEIRLVNCSGDDLVPDMAHMRSLVDSNTVILVGSAPAYPHGLIDPLQAINDLAVEKNIWMHVDACVGGYLLPFLEQLGEPIPLFDFRLPAVHSISLDIHKYGYGAKGSSVILFRNSELRKNQYYVYTEWPGGLYASPTVTGTRPGGAIAAAWAIMNFLGKSGYRKIARETLTAAQKIQQGINDTKGIKVVGNPLTTVFSFASEGKIDIYRLGDELSAMGWHLDRQLLPPSLHLTVSNGNIPFADDFVRDVKTAAENLSKNSVGNFSDSLKQSITTQAAKILPENLLKKIANRSIKDMPNQTDNTGKTAPLYGLMGELSGTGTLEDMVLNLLDAMNKPGKESFE
jgi:sphinganine-1-phosphate aldolase